MVNKMDWFDFEDGEVGALFTENVEYGFGAIGGGSERKRPEVDTKRSDDSESSVIHRDGRHVDASHLSEIQSGMVSERLFGCIAEQRDQSPRHRNQRSVVEQLWFLKSQGIAEFWCDIEATDLDRMTRVDKNKICENLLPYRSDRVVSLSNPDELHIDFVDLQLVQFSSYSDPVDFLLELDHSRRIKADFKGVR